MSAKRRWRLLRGVLFALILLLLLLLGAQWWLGTAIGRGVVESRLSDAFGRPVRLDGEFAVGIFPLPGASGTELKFFTSDGRWLVVDAGSFLARLSPRALLKGEVEVMALRLEEAGVDLGRLASEPSAVPETADAYFRIPNIRSFQLDGVSLYFDGMGSQPLVHIEELSIDEFEVDAPARFETEVSVASAGSEWVGISAAGNLTLWAGGVAEAAVTHLDLAVYGWRANGFEGGVSADFVRSLLAIDLQLNNAETPFSVAGRVAWDLDFPDEMGGYLIEEIEFVSGMQRIAGSGCLLDGAPPVLHATLSSETINLDALNALVDSWRLPADDASGPLPDEVGEQQPAGEGEDGLPFDLAVQLEVDKATFRGALADGILLSAGARPECP